MGLPPLGLLVLGWWGEEVEVESNVDSISKNSEVRSTEEDILPLSVAPLCVVVPVCLFCGAVLVFSGEYGSFLQKSYLLLCPHIKALTPGEAIRYLPNSNIPPPQPHGKPKIEIRWPTVPI